MRVKSFVKGAAAVVPLILGTATPAYGCLLLPENQGTDQADESSEQISEGPVGTGPNAPFDSLQQADQRNGDAPGFSCYPMCDAGQ